MIEAQAARLVAFVRSLVLGRDDFRAMAVCGSWARGDARSDSDLDILILASDPIRIRRRQNWLRDLPYSTAGFRYRSHQTATYGVVWSAHIELTPDAELELSFAFPNWADTSPIDEGTYVCVSGGFRIEADKDQALHRLVAACAARQTGA
jgi:predicted nucleotidyltransferase